MALATSMTVPAVGTLLMFSLVIGPAAAARAVTARPGIAMGRSVPAVGTLLMIGPAAAVWRSIGLSCRTNWPLGFFVGVAGAVFTYAPTSVNDRGVSSPGTVREPLAS